MVRGNLEVLTVNKTKTKKVKSNQKDKPLKKLLPSDVKAEKNKIKENQSCYNNSK